jgi:hypothetical protein
MHESKANRQLSSNRSLIVLCACVRGVQEFQQKKTTVLIRLFRFLHLIFRSHPDLANWLATQLFESHDFYALLFQSLLCPEQHGFALTQTKRIKQLQTTIGGLCHALLKLGDEAKEQMVKALERYASLHEDECVDWGWGGWECV